MTKSQSADTLSLPEKEQALREIIASYGSVAVAWSGGVDSTFLAAFAHEVLGENALMINGRSPSLAPEEAEFVERFAAARGIRLRMVDVLELANPDYAANPPNRCYFCKTELFETLWKIVNKEGIAVLAAGDNADDLGDHRPGKQAAKEQNVKNPLQDAGMTKDDIRKLSQAMGLPTWDKPAMACLASRFPYGEHLDEPKLKRVAAAESVMRELGFRVFRVRSHGDVARLELGQNELERGFLMREELVTRLKATGFTWVALDLQGFRSGAMNERLPPGD